MNSSASQMMPGAAHRSGDGVTGQTDGRERGPGRPGAGRARPGRVGRDKTSFDGNHNPLIVAVSLAAGLLPAVQPNFYEHFPSDFQVIFGSSITSTVIVVFTLNLVFNHWTRRPKGESAVSLAVREGAVAVDVPDDGAAVPA
jgi:hypothetical protein